MPVAEPPCAAAIPRYRSYPLWYRLPPTFGLGFARHGRACGLPNDLHSWFLRPWRCSLLHCELLLAFGYSIPRQGRAVVALVFSFARCVFLNAAVSWALFGQVTIDDRVAVTDVFCLHDHVFFLSHPSRFAPPPPLPLTCQRFGDWGQSLCRESRLVGSSAVFVRQPIVIFCEAFRLPCCAE